VEGLRRELADAREQQAATSDIGETLTDIEPVFDTIITSAVRLCGARMGVVFRFDGELVHFMAQHNYPPKAIEILRRIIPTTSAARSGLGPGNPSPVRCQIEDMRADQLYHREQALAGDWISILAVPMLRDGVPIGAIVIARREIGHFPEGHIEILKIFAKEAVIAIENTRLFEAEQARTRELQAPFDRQSATAEVLGVISRSPSETRPVFDAIEVQSTPSFSDA
jgi:two-component system, NtrC family, sensor kinase